MDMQRTTYSVSAMAQQLWNYVDHALHAVSADAVAWTGVTGKPSEYSPQDHASRHQNGGSDEISVAGLSGELADAQTPKDHAATHLPGGGDALSENVRFTPEGGVAILLKNRSGAPTVKGEIVEAGDQTGSFAQAGANDVMPIGVVYEAGVAADANAWIVIGGIADVLFDAGGCTIGDWVGTGGTAGSADGDNATPAAAQHFQEIGHALETRVGAGLAKCVIHFN